MEHQDTFFPSEFSNEYQDQTIHFPLNNKNIKIGGCYSWKRELAFCFLSLDKEMRCYLILYKHFCFPPHLPI